MKNPWLISAVPMKLNQNSLAFAFSMRTPTSHHTLVLGAVDEHSAAHSSTKYKQGDWLWATSVAKFTNVFMTEWNPVTAAHRFQMLMDTFLRDLEPGLRSPRDFLWILYSASFNWLTLLLEEVKWGIISKEDRSCWETDWHDRLTTQSHNVNMRFLFKSPALLLLLMQLNLPVTHSVYSNKNEKKRMKSVL